MPVKINARPCGRAAGSLQQSIDALGRLRAAVAWARDGSAAAAGGKSLRSIGQKDNAPFISSVELTLCGIPLIIVLYRTIQYRMSRVLGPRYRSVFDNACRR